MIVSLIHFYLKNYLKSNKFIVPLIGYFAYQAMAYSIIPVDVLPSYSLSAMVAFLIMVWISFSFNEVEPIVTEQIIYLKVKNKTWICLSKIILMLFFGIILSIVGTLYPLLANVVNHGDLFSRPVQIGDVIYSTFTHILFSCVGSMLGLIFHGRIVKNRKQAVIFVFCIALATVVKGSIEQDIPFIRSLTWIFPPLYNYSLAGSKMDVLILTNLLIPLGLVVCYLLVEIILYIQLTKHKLFQ